MKQVVVIHGGDSFQKRSEYVRWLRSIAIPSPALKAQRGWKANLRTDLGRGWDIVRPTMPNDMNARYEDWKIWFEKYRPYIKTNAIFIGHSLGGIFLAKYFSERNWPKRIKAVVLVAPPYNRTTGVGDFRLRRPLTNLARQVKRIFIFHSHDDPIVPFRELAAYQRALPQAVIFPLKNKGHVTGSHFPELVALLKTL